MINTRLSLRLAALATLTLSSLLPFSSTKAATFGEQDLDQTQVIGIARPFGENRYDLLVIEQIPGKQQCWREIGSAPAMVEPLLLDFDFTGICRRATDSNGYSIRIDDNDYGLEYLLRVVERNGELFLVGTPRSSNLPEIIVARTWGLNRGFMKFILEPGWQFSKRQTADGKVLTHFYFSGDSVAIAAASGMPRIAPPPVVATFSDISDDIYKTEIEKAIALGFVAGYKEDNTFRPNNPVTREQLVSMVIEAMNKVTPINLDTTSATTSFSDVADDRWSAKKIKWAQANGIVAGSANNTFRPADPITRAELVVILKKVTEYTKGQMKLSQQLAATKTPVQFADISGHWASAPIEQMSSYCGIASPLNEQGTDFAPNQPANRNYAAAAIVRMLNCVQTEVKK